MSDPAEGGADAEHVVSAAARPPTRRRWVRWLLWALAAVAAVAAIAAGAFVYWGLTPQQATREALLASASGGGFTVEHTAQGWTFTPRGAPTHPAWATGLVLYPGGHVDPRAYAPLAREIALHGYLVVVPPMPLSLAFLDVDAASGAMAAHPEVGIWAVGGHSLGGTAACIYVDRHPRTVFGLVLLASYPASSTDLSQAENPKGEPLAAISIRGSNDRLATQAKIDRTRGLLPPGTIYMGLPGGNHAQFGSYGIQSGDGTATMSATRQVRLTADAVSLFLESLGKPKPLFRGNSRTPDGLPSSTPGK